MNKTALITGATSGIGEATAHTLAKLGYDIIVTGRRAEKLEQVKQEICAAYPVKVLALCFDVRVKEECCKAIASIPEEFSEITVLFNNAGLAAGLEHIQDGDTDDWERMIDTNIKGVLYMTRCVAPLMIKQGKGHIINMGSIAGTEVYENGTVYCASKHAMNALSKGMRIDMLSSGIKVSQIRPGMVETEFSVVRFHGDQQRADNVYKGVKPLTGADIASVVEWLVTLPEHVNINDVEIMPVQQADAFYTYRK